jgi:hypothetical protein
MGEEKLMVVIVTVRERSKTKEYLHQLAILETGERRGEEEKDGQAQTFGPGSGAVVYPGRCALHDP